jgi:hypothetical protein
MTCAAPCTCVQTLRFARDHPTAAPAAIIRSGNPEKECCVEPLNEPVLQELQGVVCLRPQQNQVPGCWHKAASLGETTRVTLHTPLKPPNVNSTNYYNHDFCQALILSSRRHPQYMLPHQHRPPPFPTCASL